MSYLDVPFFVLLFFIARRGDDVWSASWRREIIAYIDSSDDWFTTQGVVRATRAPRGLVLQVVISLARSGVLHAMESLPTGATECGAPAASAQAVAGLESLSRVLEAAPFVRHKLSVNDLQRYQFCVDRTNDPVSIPEMDALHIRRRRPV